MTVSVLIVSCNSSPLLIECVQSVLASTSDIEVIVSDNGSDDGSIDALQDLAKDDSRLQVLRNGSNLGFAAGNNVALRRAHGDMVLFLNPDCLVEPDTIERMVAALSSIPMAGMAGCSVRNPDGSIQEDCLRPMPTPKRLLAQLFGRGSSIATEDADVEAISGAFMLVRRSDLATIGSFDEAYFLHWEDLDLCQRFRLAGRKILFVPDVEIVHCKGRSSQRRPLWIEWQKHRGLIRFLRKFYFVGWQSPLAFPASLAIVLRYFTQVLRYAIPRRTGSPSISISPAENLRPEIWVFGATSVVGRYLLPRLLVAGYRVCAFSRNPVDAAATATPHLTWHTHDIRLTSDLPLGRPDAVVHLAPLTLLPARIAVLAAVGVTRLIAFSSTSRFSKCDSPVPWERQLACDLTHSEEAIAIESSRLGLQWTIFRPTLIYSLGHDKNVSFLASFIRRFGFFPMLSVGKGKRQPVHADDLALACVAMLQGASGWNRSYNLSGGQTLTYREMVSAIFGWCGKRPRIVVLPGWILRIALALMRLHPKYRGLHKEMLIRVDTDMCYDHQPATRAFGFSPRSFLETKSSQWNRIAGCSSPYCDG